VPDEVRQRGLASLPCGRWIDDPPLPMDLQMRLRNEDGIKILDPAVARDQRSGASSYWGIPRSRRCQTGSWRCLRELPAARGGVSTVERDRKLHALAHVDA